MGSSERAQSRSRGIPCKLAVLFRVILDSVNSNFLLLKVPPILFIDQDQVKVVPGTELLVYVSVCGCQFEPTQKKSNWYKFSYRDVQRALD